MIEEKETYSSEEVKTILAKLIERIGYDSAAVCKWTGVDTTITVEEWNNALFKSMNDFHDYGKNVAYYKIAEYANAQIDD